MATKKDILQLLQTEKSNCIENKILIIKLLENGDIDNLISKINNNRITKLINFKVFEKKFLNGIEQFVVNLDCFISYYSEKLLIGESIRYVLASVFLKSKFSCILLSNKLLNDGGVNQKNYYLNFQKMIAEQFLDNLLIMKPYIYEYLKNTNIRLEKLDYSDKSYNLAFELLISLFFSNRSDLLIIISNMLINIRDNYILKSNQNYEYLRTIVVIWQSMFEDFKDKFYYVSHLIKLQYLKYTSKNNLINNNFYNLLLRVKRMNSDRIKVIISDKVGNIICENNSKYVKSMFKQINIQKIEKCLNHKREIILSKLYFNDGKVLQHNIFVVSIYNFTFRVGYILFILPDKIIDNDKKYIRLILNN